MRRVAFAIPLCCCLLGPVRARCIVAQRVAASCGVVARCAGRYGVVGSGWGWVSVWLGLGMWPCVGVPPSWPVRVERRDEGSAVGGDGGPPLTAGAVPVHLERV